MAGKFNPWTRVKSQVESGDDTMKRDEADIAYYQKAIDETADKRANAETSGEPKSVVASIDDFKKIYESGQRGAKAELEKKKRAYKRLGID